MSEPQGATRPMIEIKDLYKSFGGQMVLDGVSLKMFPGTTTVILGGSGSGKTVLMKHIIGLLKPDSGEVWVDGVEITKLKGRDLQEQRQKMGMVFQNAALFDSMSVGDN